MSISAHAIAAPFDAAGLGLAGVLNRARQDRLAAQAYADAVQQDRNITAANRAARAVDALRRVLVATRSENAALAQENARLQRELASAKAETLRARGLLVRHMRAA
ncbi:response regulator receiver protein [Methylobacterium sp. J-092]|uniref:response regulator receiver protein n=1 Tax=Methylobacterium sp. J-092 TaxID=2836667 RepID=UPI001FB974D8|nr:response regulator receiver protein [Methylobacterium sp. J-092]MCJ2009488.1 response regulator receiver protein [Methylobacterium sp. J-092]